MLNFLKKVFGAGKNHALRPMTFEDFIGQSKIKRSLQIAAKAAQKRGDSLEHVLLSGPPGLGKTTLSNIIAKTIGTQVHFTSGPMIKSPSDLADIISKMKRLDILFIDEIHRMNMKTEEFMYSAMEDFKIDIIDKKEGSVTLEVPPFTLIGATTLLGDLSEPFRARFGIICEMQYYTQTEMEEIVERSAKQLDIGITEEATVEIARRCRKTPRIANKYLRRARDMAQVEGNGLIEMIDVQESLQLLGIDKYGLSKKDRDILNVLHQHGTVGLNTVSMAVRENENTIEQVYEPFLMQEGFLIRTPRGRQLTDKGNKYVKNLLNKKRKARARVNA